MHDVAIVGAGFAGLSAALELTDLGHDVVVLEASKRVGGRTATGHTRDGQWIELGGQWVSTAHHRLRALIARFGLRTEPSGIDGRLVEVVGGVRRETDAESDPASDVLASEDRARFAAAVDDFGRIVDSVALETPWTTPSAALLDETTFAAWIRATIPAGSAREAFLTAVDAAFAPDPREVSLLHAAFYFRTADHLAALRGHARAAQEERVTGGASVVCDAIAAKLGDRVVLGDPVREIDHRDGAVHVETRSGCRYGAALAIVTVPPPLAVRLEYRPALPPAREALLQRLHSISVVKLHLVYDRPFWRDDGLSGAGILDEGPVTVVLDNTPVGCEQGLLVGFIEGADKRGAGVASPSERRDAFVAAAVRLFGEQAARPIEYLERDWMAEEFSRGCYGGHFAPGAWTGYGHALRAPVGPLHWAGTETATSWTGYMEGAVQAGQRAAGAVHGRLTAHRGRSRDSGEAGRERVNPEEERP